MRKGWIVLLLLCALCCICACGKGDEAVESTSGSFIDPAQMLTPEKLENHDCRTLGHVFSRANCLHPATCYYCGVSEGEKGAHDWTHPTCKQRSVCTVCGVETGDFAPHLFSQASCAGPASCVYCGMQSGSAGAHTFRSATCVSPSMCSVCMKKQGSALGHTWTEGSCTVDKVCTRCGRRQSAPGHKMQGGTCTEDSVCSVCGWREAASGHTFENGVCTRCGLSRGEADRQAQSRAAATTTQAATETTSAVDIEELRAQNDTLASLLEQAYTRADEALSAQDFEQKTLLAGEAVDALARAVKAVDELEAYSRTYPALSGVSSALAPIRRAIADASKPHTFYESTARDAILSIRRAAYEGQQGLPKLVKAITSAEQGQ